MTIRHFISIIMSSCGIYRNLVNTSILEFEPNTKETPFDTFLVSQRREITSQCTIALGLPPPRGMFKTPNPTPPSSHDSSPATSPLWIDRVPTSFSTMCDRIGEMGPTLTVPTLRVAQALPSSRHQTNFNFDINQLTLNLPQISCENAEASTTNGGDEESLPNETGSTDTNDAEHNNNISIQVEVPLCHGLKSCDESPKKIPSADIRPKSSSLTSASLPKLPLKRNKYYEPAFSDCSNMTNATSRNGLLRRNSDIPKSLVDKDAKLIYYFRPSQSTPPTPHNS